MEQQQAPSVFGIATKYGLIQGVLLFGTFLLPVLTRIQAGWITSVINTALIVVFIVLAHQEFKRANAGKMTYAQGLGSGTLLSSVAALITSVLIYVYVQYINTGYFAAVMEATRAALAQRGMTGEQAQQAMAMTAVMRTPVGIAVTSLILAVIWGFIVALIVSIFTQKDPRAI
jgi:hypothetical protein